MRGILVLAILCLAGTFATPSPARSVPRQRGDMSVAYDAGGFSGAMEYSQDIKDKGEAGLYLGKKGEDWTWRARGATSDGKVALSFGLGDVGNSFSIRPRPYDALSLRHGAGGPPQPTVLSGTCHPSDLIVDARIMGFRLVGAAAVAASATDLFSEPGAVLRARAEMAGIEYGAVAPGWAGALSLCVSHLPSKENSGGWQPDTPAVVEGSLASLSGAGAFSVAGAEVNIWTGMSTGYFDRPGFAARVELGQTGPALPGAGTTDIGLCLFLASPTYRLVGGGWPGSDSLFRVTAGIRDGTKSARLVCALYSARGWQYSPLAAAPRLSGAGLFFEYMKPTLLKSRLDVSCGSTDGAGTVELDGAGITRLGFSLDFEKKLPLEASPLGPSKWRFTKVRFGPRCGFIRSSLSAKEDGEEDENDGTGDEDGNDVGDEDSFDTGNSSGGAVNHALVPEKLGCLFELHWVAGSKIGRQGSGRLSFEAAYHQKSAENCFGAFVLSISQAVPVTENLEAVVLLKSPSGGWQTRAGREVVPVISLGITMKRGDQK